jgi:S1-C subfamily serine protease
MKLLLRFLVLFALVPSLTGCVTMLYPRNQKVVINTNNENAKIYVDDELVGKGKSVETKVRKEGAKQVMIETPNSKKKYYVLFPDGRGAGFFPVYLLNILNFGAGIGIDLQVSHGFNYSKSNSMPGETPIPARTEKDKFINVEAIKMDLVNKNKDIVDYEIFYSRDIMRSIAKAEQEKSEKDAKKEAKDRKKGKKKLSESDDNLKFKSDNTLFIDNILKNVRKFGYVDTVNTIFTDINNTLTVEGAIKRINDYTIRGSQFFRYYKCKMDMLWYLKNSYGEIIDSVKTSEFSGDFSIREKDYYNNEVKTDILFKMYADAVENSFFKMKETATFRKNFAVETYQKPTQPLISILKPSTCVNELADATSSSVIIKRKDGGHGSGFAISNDGYILTNFHVIAGKMLDKTENVKVILSTGEEISANIVRYNRNKDVALLKVDRKFDKAFMLAPDKAFKSLMEVYTVGTPKSIELGQTVSIGIISNERNLCNTNLLQLSMSVNSGNSGGPLFEKSGKLHGIIASKLFGIGTEGISFAIPSYMVFDYLNIAYN